VLRDQVSHRSAIGLVLVGFLFSTGFLCSGEIFLLSIRRLSITAVIHSITLKKKVETDLSREEKETTCYL